MSSLCSSHPKQYRVLLGLGSSWAEKIQNLCDETSVSNAVIRSLVGALIGLQSKQSKQSKQSQSTKPLKIPAAKKLKT